MWTIFSRDSSKDFPYEITDCGNYEFNKKSLWNLNKGKKKNTVQEVSIFEFISNDDTLGNETRTVLAKSAIKHLKTLKHPNFISFLESSEVKTSIYLTTEYVEPLNYFLSCQEDLNETIMKHYISWGIYNIIEGLKFLNFEAKLCHNKVCIWSVFINKGGQWKLGELEYMNSVDSSPQSDVNNFYHAPGHQNTSYSIDVWGLGILIWEIFNGPLSHISNLKNIKKIPSEILKIYPKLISVNPTKRPSYDVIISSLQEQKYFGHDLEKTMTSLNNYHLLDTAQRTAFLEKLPNLLDTFPKNITQHHILPKLLEMFNYVKEQKIIFPSMIKLSTMLNDDEFEKNIIPCIIKLFDSNDRATRLLLLNQIELYADRLKPDLLNASIFPLLVSGLADANPIIRELTIRSMIPISSKLNYNNINVELMRHFACLQMKDNQDSIRTNTTVCLGKLAQYLDPKIRSKILSSAFCRALKDPFPPSRIAGVSAFSATQQYYSLLEVSTRVLPALCQITVDPEKSVRDITFQTIKGFLGKLESVSENPSLKEKNEEEFATTNPNIPTWAGWAVTTVTSKFYSSKNIEKNDKSTESSKSNLKLNSSNSNNGTMHNKLPNAIDIHDYYEKPQDNILQEPQEYTNSVTVSILPDHWDDNSGWNVTEDWENISNTSSFKNLCYRTLKKTKPILVGKIKTQLF
ncbi:Hypothetical protein CINCED_3A008055 [Cinara cedri]|uniref:N-terminal kinase-like protein n=1 Tax=Cinara cedri TaxID=506608 RepID=A0A5E4M436_9HEMI|nr:Hypothetical protein CINCED_3A008055 [Cinara cedri]